MKQNYLSEYEKELQLILDLSYDMITIADGKGILTAASKSCERYFGIPEQELIGMGSEDLERNGIFDQSITAKVVQTGSKSTMVQRTASGKTLFVTSHPIFDDQGKLSKIISFSKDITEEESLNAEVKNLQSELDWCRNELWRRQAIHDSKVACQSPAVQRLMELIKHVANSTVTVLLLGETGVGKSYFAKLIHELSPRKDAPFVTINCGAIPKELLESELFGYEEGAFTGAKRGGKKGLFELAKNGTIFLDEIGDMHLELQVKLLHVLDHYEVLRIGGSQPIRIQARIVAATNKDLKKLIQDGKFREDLYYRLSVVPITIPPLRERREDIPYLTNLFFEKFNQKYGTKKQLTESGYAVLSHFHFSGNIRELEHTVERLIVTSPYEFIDASQIRLLELFSSEDSEPAPNSPTEAAPDELDQIVSLKQAVEAYERRILTQALRRYKTTRKVGEALKLDQSTVVKKMKRLHVTAPDE
ncbi:PAS domain S-box protein [Flavonifractor sp. An92]|uniref:sigma-54 interaction domain-containing protein n=1 Tax=Flavonifractor sp. An92 TaxID=1965666 RepID=UPI000B3A99DF|nr:sigma 54-interacting transcriptional regulator [Flavonifractor sp. An92]OUN06000.1 PAS domain S-box protein [Flavonifractor sp. An92]